MTIKQIQYLLAYLGFDPGTIDGMDGPNTRKAVTAFQKAFGLPPDGGAGEDTQKALRHAVAYGMPEKEVPESGTFWSGIRHFTRDEFRCPCGKWCNGYPVEPSCELVKLMDELREVFGGAIIIVPPDGHSGGSGIRCEKYNAAFDNSAKNSYHLRGKAADWKCPGAAAAVIEAELARRKQSGQIRYWYRICPGSYHVDVD